MKKCDPLDSFINEEAGMKKVMLSAALLALVLAAAVPAVAQSMTQVGVGILLVAGGLLARKIVR